jgi:predicted RNA methylase
MLGAGAVTGFDIDEEALETAAENIQVEIFMFFWCIVRFCLEFETSLSLLVGREK